MGNIREAGNSKKPESDEISVIGAYDSIRKGGKSDFPFITDLVAVMAGLNWTKWAWIDQPLKKSMGH
jgi:hypothetical protein